MNKKVFIYQYYIFNKMVGILERLRSKKDIGELLEGLSDETIAHVVARLIGKHKIPERFVDIAIRVKDQKGDYMRAGEIARDAGRLGEAIEFFKKQGSDSSYFSAAEIARKQGLVDEANELNDQGILRILENDRFPSRYVPEELTDRALELAREHKYYRKGAFLAEISGRKHEEAELHALAGDHWKSGRLYEELCQHKEAIEQYLLCISELDQIIDKSRKAGEKLNPGTLTEQRSGVLRKVLLITEEQGYKQIEVDIHLKLNQFYEAGQVSEEAARHALVEVGSEYKKQAEAAYRQGIEHYLKQNDFFNLARCEKALGLEQETDESFAHAINQTRNEHLAGKWDGVSVANRAMEAEAFDIAMEFYEKSTQFANAEKAARRLGLEEKAEQYHQLAELLHRI